MSREPTNAEIIDVIESLLKYAGHSRGCGDGWGCCCNVNYKRMAAKDLIRKLSDER